MGTTQGCFVLFRTNSGNQHPTTQSLFSPLPPIFQTIQIRLTRHMRHCWRSKGKFINDILLWTTAHGHISVDWSARTWLQQPCADTRLRIEDLPRVMDNRNGWHARARERAREKERERKREREIMSEWGNSVLWTRFDVYIYIYIYTSCRAASTDIPDPLSPLLPIVHRLWQVFRATSCFCPAICAGPLEYIPYELVPASPVESCMSGASSLDSFRDGRPVAI